jgi:hypothetical protein
MTRKLREQFLSGKWLIIGDEVACKSMIKCSHAAELRSTGEYLYKDRCK